MDIQSENIINNFVKNIGKLRDLESSQSYVGEIKRSLDKIFGDTSKCMTVIYNVNTDKLPFGCIVFPVLIPGSFNNFMLTGEPIKFTSYEVEIDSKMFDYGLTDEEVSSVVLYNIYHLLKETNSCDRIRAAIDDFFTDEDKNLSIKDSIQYQTILMLGIVDYLHQTTSCFHLPDEVTNDNFLDSIGLPGFRTAIEKLYREIPGCENEILRQPQISMLNWCLRLYDNVDTERIPALRLLDKAKEITASKLYQTKFNSVIQVLNTIITESTVRKNVQHCLNELGLLASLKYKGLRDIENDLYEYYNRAKNSVDEVDVYYALKQINARLAILDDYILEYPQDPKIDRWKQLKQQYQDIRVLLAKRKLHRGMYSLVAVDYDHLGIGEE